MLGLSAFLSASCLVLGLFLSYWIPFVKNCWTTSFALASAGALTGHSGCRHP